MSINYWRYVEYTDDGCCRYQCLSCYKGWESRTVPGWFDMEDRYTPVFKFCPFCGTEWAGMQTTGFGRLHEGCRQYGRRRQRIEDAIEQRRNRWRYGDEGARPGYPPEPPYWLVIEKAEYDGRDPDKPLSWWPEDKMSGFHPDAKRMLKLAREDAERANAEHMEACHGWEDSDYFGWRQRKFLFRVIAVRDLKAKYGDTYISEIRP